MREIGISYTKCEKTSEVFYGNLKLTGTQEFTPPDGHAAENAFDRMDVIGKGTLRIPWHSVLEISVSSDCDEAYRRDPFGCGVASCTVCEGETDKMALES